MTQNSGHACGHHWGRSLRCTSAGSRPPSTSCSSCAVVGHERRFSGDRLTLYDFTAERQSDGGFLISAMRHRWPLLEAQMQRQRGDCFAGLILGLGDGCHYPSSREPFVVLPDGSIGFGGRSPLRYDDAFVFREWGPQGRGRLLLSAVARRTTDPREDRLRQGAIDRSCFVGLTVHPGRSLLGWPRPAHVLRVRRRSVLRPRGRQRRPLCGGRRRRPGPARRAPAGPQLHHPRTRASAVTTRA